MTSLTTDIALAAKALQKGGVVAFPTETVYGLGACAGNDNAVKKIFALKGRPADHPLIVHVQGAEDFANWAEPVPRQALTLASSFMPGPLTLIMRRRRGVGELASGGHASIALRIPALEQARRLIGLAGGALVAPSANRFGRPSSTEAAHVVADFAGTDLLVLDGGATSIGIESTIIDLRDPGKPALARPGAVSLDRIRNALHTDVAATSDVAAPGSLGSHYSPRQNVLVLTGDGFCGCVANHPNETVAAMGFEQPQDLDGTRWRRISREPQKAAKDFYRALRELELTDATLIVIEQPPATTDWMALSDRASRAAGQEPGCGLA